MNRNPWQDVPDVWKDEKAYLQWLRSSIRKVWSRHPVKNEYKKQRRFKAPIGINGKEIWAGSCEMCGKMVKSSQTEIDHITQGGSFNDWTSFCEWSKRILWVTFDDIRELCTGCHEEVTLSQKLGCSLEEAKVEKQAIKVCKMKAEDINNWLIEHGYKGKLPTNQKQRREVVRGVLQNEQQT